MVSVLKLPRLGYVPAFAGFCLLLVLINNLGVRGRSEAEQHRGQLGIALDVIELKFHPAMVRMVHDQPPHV